MTEFEVLNSCVGASFKGLLRGYNLELDWPVELRGNTLFIFLPDLDGLTLWQNSYRELLAAAQSLGISNLRLQDPSRPRFTEVNVPSILETQVGVEVLLFQGN